LSLLVESISCYMAALENVRVVRQQVIAMYKKIKILYNIYTILFQSQLGRQDPLNIFSADFIITESGKAINSIR